MVACLSPQEWKKITVSFINFASCRNSSPLELAKFPEDMEQRRCRGDLLFCFSFSCAVLLSSVSGAHAYENFTVGNTLGWFDKLMKPEVDYQKWVVGKNFSLGDFLIFNTDKNHSVIQTYNITTYRKCDYNNAEEDDTIQWSAGEPTVSAEAVTVPVPLLKEGMTYFFSGDYDGEQCKHGQHFKINVTHGEGLPNSLKEADAAPAPGNPDDDNSTPDTVVSSNFDKPVESTGDDDDKSGASSLPSPWFVKVGVWKLGGVLGFLGVVWLSQ